MGIHFLRPTRIESWPRRLREIKELRIDFSDDALKSTDDVGNLAK